MEPVRLEILLDDKTLKGMLSVEGNLGDMGKYTQAVIAQLESQLKDLQNQFKQAMASGTNTNAEMAEIQALAGVVEQLKAELKALEAQKKKTNSTPILSDDPAPKLNNLKMSMTQIARELPALAMGPQMFFLAISNNIGPFQDSLAAAKKAYQDAIAAGQKATPVWKQMLSALFSWQTAIATATTLVVVYGKEIGNFIKSMLSASKATVSLTDAQKKINDSFTSGSSKVGDQIAKIRSLQEQWNHLGNNLKEKKEFIKDNADEFKKLDVAIKDVDDAENLLVKNTPAFIQALALRAQAAAAQELAAKEYARMLSAQAEQKNAGEANVFQALYRGLFEIVANKGGKKEEDYFTTQINQAKKAGDVYTELGVKAEEAAKKMLKAAGIDDYEKDKKDTGLIRPQEGETVIIASNGKTVPMNAETRHLFAYVPQGNTILSGTIAENMRMVKEDATDEEIIEALKISCAWDFVQHLPDTINSRVGERGRGFSEGQSQRLAIARAVLRDAPVLLLDEATSALDVTTERNVLRNIIRQRPNKTCIVTTHRPSVLGLCQRVYRVMNGTVAELDGAEGAKMVEDF